MNPFNNTHKYSEREIASIRNKVKCRINVI